MSNGLTTNRARALMWSSALTAIATPTLAWAQAVKQPPATQATSSDEEEIIVTAQRRAERLEDVPMTVTVVSPDTLKATGVNSVRDLANVTTGFQVGNAGSIPQPAIRGITTTNAGSYENNVALFVDGVYQFTPLILNMDLPNVQDIQVLKGPQGTLYGRNATGGAILINTIDPGKELAGNVEATYGRFNDRRLRGYVTVPLSEKIGFSLAGTFRKTGGYVKKASRTTPGQFDGRFLGLEQESVRAKLKFELTDSLRATLAYNYTRASDPRGVLFTPIENVQLSYVPPGRNTRPTGLGEAAGDLFILDFKQHEGSLKLELDTGIGTLRSITGYTEGRNKTYFDFGGSYVPDGISGSLILDKTWQESIDYNITAIHNLDLVVGGNYYNIKSRFGDGQPNANWTGPAAYFPFTYPDPATTVIPFPDPAYRKAAETFFFRTKEAWAVFVDATFHATDKLSINVGGRYSKERQDVSGTKNIYCVDPTSAATLGCTVGALIRVPYTIATSARSSHYKQFTPRASIRYEIAPRTNVYASYSRGFRAGEWNSVLPSDNPALWVDAKQETVNAYEIGLKSAGHRLRFDIAGFYYDYRNLQVSNTQAVGNPPVAVVILTNAPKAKIYGVDASLDFKVTDNFTVRGGVTWLHARYGDGFVLNGTGVNPAVAGFNVSSDPLKTFANISVAQDLSGLQMARSPNFTGFLGLDYLVPKGKGGLRFTANVKYTTSYVVTNPSVWGGETLASFNARFLLDPNAVPNNAAILTGTPYVNRARQQRARQGAYALVNASVTWTDPADHYYVRVWGNNLTDKKYRTHYNPLVGSGTYQPIGEPLTFGGTVGYKF
jgi:iron complex outermembrane receptor protein